MRYGLEEASKKVIESGLRLLDSGLIARTWGNVSARLSDKEFVITPSGRAYETLKPEDLALVSIADCSYDPNGPKPSSEKLLHAAIYKLRPEVDFIVHTHQNYATALSTLGETLRNTAAKADGAVLGPRIPTAQYGISGSKKLAENVAACLKADREATAVLMKNHGAVILGRTPEETFAAADQLEDLAKKIYMELVGEDYPGEPEDAADLKKYMSFSHADIHEENYKWNQIFQKTGARLVAECRSPYVMKLSAYGKPVPAYVDDMAQYAGVKVRCLPASADDGDVAAAMKELPAAVLIKGCGAVIAAPSEDEAEALLMVMEKNCRAALLERTGNKPARVGAVEGVLEHIFYVRKYSKRRDA